MYTLIRRVHLYLGLLSASVLLIYGLEGLRATVAGPPEGRARPAPEVRFVDFAVPANLPDAEAARLIWSRAGVPLSAPPAPFAIRRDKENRLVVSFYTVNGPSHVTALEKEGKLRIEAARNSLMEYLGQLHATTLRNNSTDWRVRLWTWYNEFAAWTLLALAVSGVYLWLAARSSYRPAAAAAVLGLASFCALYFFSR